MIRKQRLLECGEEIIASLISTIVLIVADMTSESEGNCFDQVDFPGWLADRSIRNSFTGPHFRVCASSR